MPFALVWAFDFKLQDDGFCAVWKRKIKNVKIPINFVKEYEIKYRK